MAANVDWTDRLDARLLILRKQGMSGSEAGAALGLSKNACLARAAKLGHPFCKRLPQDRTSVGLNLRLARVPKVSAVPLPEAPAMPFPPLNIPFMELSEAHCRDVMGMGDDGLAIYCGHTKKPGSSYCQHHSGINEVVAPPARSKSLFRFGGKAA